MRLRILFFTKFFYVPVSVVMIQKGCKIQTKNVYKGKIFNQKKSKFYLPYLFMNDNPAFCYTCIGLYKHCDLLRDKYESVITISLSFQQRYRICILRPQYMN